MTRMTMFMAVGAASLSVAATAAAQQPYPYPYPQQGYPQQGYPQPGYPQGQYGYPPQGQDVVSQMIGQLLGNRYNSNDRYAVERCATAAMAEANARYRNNQYGQGYGYQNQGYGYGNRGNYPGAAMRVTAITEVQRRDNGLRVSGLIDSRGVYQQPYGNAYGYQGQGQGYGYQGQAYQDPRYAAQGDLTFRCNVDYRGAVTNVRVRRNSNGYRGY